MAKKKLTHQPRDPNKQEPTHQQPLPNAHQIAEPISTPMAMEDPSSDKVQTLKSLNSRLLKETVERRQQIESLVTDKKALEAELTRSGADKEELEARLTSSIEENVGLGLEKEVFCVFWESQISEMGVGFYGLLREKKVEIERVKSERDAEIGYLKREVNELVSSLESERDRLSLVCLERDAIRRDYDGLVAETDGFREKAMELEKREGSLKAEVKNLKTQCAGLMEEKEESQRAVEALMREKDLAQRNLVERESVIENLKRDIEGIVREKNEIEKQKSGLELRVGELEKEVEELNGTVLRLRREVETLQGKIVELENFIDESRKEREMEVKSWLEEKKEKEHNIELLQVQMDGVKKILDAVSQESEDYQRKIEEVTQQKNGVEEAKVNLERVIVELQNETIELRDSVFTLRNSLRDREGKNEDLVSEIGHYKDDLDRVTRQRDKIQKDFDEKKIKVENLTLVVSEREKSIEELVEDLRKLRIERETLIEKTKVTESRLESQVKEKDKAQCALLDAQSRIDEWKAKSESAGINLERALTMLKNTAALVSSGSELERNGKKEAVINEHKLDDVIQACIPELDAIQNAFKNKEKMLEDMKQQLELLQLSAKDAHKKKSFWTMVSSAITIFAAASVAYVAKGR
ncbi:uncharacterized protein LOC107412071 [Ziziphus jujuba]|uniref:Uncharacterized protein LOC107412071 n=1 Tax=Ziziphus jujuba TaxID=326968 RepID=A0A6P3ZAJ6_ZIZJJ|nr:uncharacterized protein LOC107412071 [Ziziphus jujuba]